MINGDNLATSDGVVGNTEQMNPNWVMHAMNNA